MKHSRILLILAMIAVVAVASHLVFRTHRADTWFDSGFSTQALLRYHWVGKRTDTMITDANDVEDLKAILSGWVHQGHPPCETDDGVSIMLTGSGRSIELRPALDGGYIELRSGSTYMGYLEVKGAQWKRFDHIVRKYGMYLDG